MFLGLYNYLIFFFFNVPYKESVKYKLEDSFILWWMRVNTHCSHHVALLCEHGIYCGVCPLKCHLWLIYRHGNHNFQLFCWGLCTDFIWRRCACLRNKNFIPLRNCWMWTCWCRSLYQGHLIVYKKKISWNNIIQVSKSNIPEAINRVTEELTNLCPWSPGSLSGSYLPGGVPSRRWHPRL